ncbi:hypothetical protein N0V84_005964 [Fusarium piperis]|uniref:Knr4/Smi1-like domain-containing protein n=1 Tax=Fusarium piperis TaxID=1435070 RepID=A0A9W9BNK6_9HYPO|nr:hypothetical protein N0V84_005964 [Fusarium piperis]
MATEYIDGPKPEQFPFEFLLRHVDDEPTISDYRFFQQVATGIIETALGFAIVGEVRGATKLLETLKKRGVDPFGVLDRSYPFLKPCMYFAWEATSSWPAWIPDEERTEKRLEELEGEGRTPWLERFNEEWQVSEETAKKALDMAHLGIATALPDYNGTLAGQVAQAEAMWKNGEFPSAANPNGPMTVRYAKLSMWWRQGIYPYPYVQVYRTAGLMIALDIYLRLGKEEEAQSTFEMICGRFQYEEQAEQLACSRMAWKKLLTAPGRPVLDVLEIHPAKLRPAVTRALQMAEHRLEHGPTRRYKDKSIEKLAHAVSANTFHNCPYDVLAAYRPPGKPRPRSEDANGLLRPPCSPSDIADLEKRLRVTLPEDYKEFLGVTNGLGSMWNGQNMVNYLVKAEDVCWQDIDFLEGNAIPLLCDGDPSPFTDNRLDWPEVGSFRTICLSGDQNREESSGHLFLLPPEMIQERKDYFFKEYEKRNESQRHELDRVVKEIYGSIETFRNLEYALISWTPWDIEFHPYNGIRDLLERMAEAGLHKDRPWLNIFEPRYRRLA